MYSLGYNRRLHKKHQFIQFFYSPEVFRTPECVFFRVKNTAKTFRLGITLKIKTSSVVRNKLKRQIREVFRKSTPKLGEYDYNIVIPNSKKVDHNYIIKLRKNLFRKIETL